MNMLDCTGGPLAAPPLSPARDNADMTKSHRVKIRPARATDAEDLARLIDIAGEGIPNWLWQKSATGTETALDVGIARARRMTGGFSYRNALVAEDERGVLGMVLSYAIDSASEDDPDDLPAPIAPFVALEAKSIGTWYVNALAVRAGNRGEGIGTALMQEVEAQARALGYRRFSIQVYGQNQGAVKLYHRMGFQEVARAPVRDHPCQPYYTGDVLLLIRTVSD